MAFGTTFTATPAKVGSGVTLEMYSNDKLATNDFEDGLLIGRFAKLDGGAIDNLDGSATPTIAGVVASDSGNPVDDNGAYTVGSGRPEAINYVRNGYVTVEVKSGESPAQFGTVYAYNAGGADDGKAVTTSTDAVDAGAEFISEISATVWLVRIK